MKTNKNIIATIMQFVVKYSINCLLCMLSRVAKLRITVQSSSGMIDYDLHSNQSTCNQIPLVVSQNHKRCSNALVAAVLSPVTLRSVCRAWLCVLQWVMLVYIKSRVSLHTKKTKLNLTFSSNKVSLQNSINRNSLVLHIHWKFIIWRIHTFYTTTSGHYLLNVHSIT